MDEWGISNCHMGDGIYAFWEHRNDNVTFTIPEFFSLDESIDNLSQMMTKQILKWGWAKKITIMWESLQYLQVNLLNMLDEMNVVFQER